MAGGISLNTSQQVALFAEGFEHKHYIGEAKQYEVLEELEGHGKGFFIKVFFINTKVNLNKWQVTWDAIEQDISDVVGVPIVLQEDLRHPHFSIQNLYAKGYIVDYVLDKEKQEASVIARILDPKTIKLIQSGKLKFVSPAIVARSNLTLETLASGVDLLSRFIALHLALVGEPAYGKVDAKIHATCTGTGQTCGAKLRQMSAVVMTMCQQKEADHIQKIIKREHELLDKGIPETEVHKMLVHEFGAENIPGSDGQKMAPLTQTKLMRKLEAAVNRIESEFDMFVHRASRHEFGGKWGYWMNANNIDVFVADGKTVDESIKEQCPCQLSATTGKISKERANYQESSGEHKCENCRFFNYTKKKCEVVEGSIDMNFVSDLYQPHPD